MKTIVMIPARLQSSRLPEKVLIDIKGKTMLQRVFERVQKAKQKKIIDEIYIATDSKKIQKEVLKFTKNVVMTSSKHSSGTDRIAEAVQKIDCDYIINVQGDEPLVEVTLIEKLVNALQNNQTEFVTAAYLLLSEKQILDPAKVKVVLNQQQQAIYFSRAAIPYSKDYQAQYYCHIGIYGYSRKFLLHFTKLPRTSLEKCEKLEQLRAIQMGYAISVVLTKKPSFGIDTPEDARKILDYF